MKSRLKQSAQVGIALSAVLMTIHLSVTWVIYLRREYQQLEDDTLRQALRTLEQSLQSEGKAEKFDEIRTTPAWGNFVNELDNYAWDSRRQHTELNEKTKELAVWRPVNSLSVALAGSLLGLFIGIRVRLGKEPTL